MTVAKSIVMVKTLSQKLLPIWLLAALEMLLPLRLPVQVEHNTKWVKPQKAMGTC